MKLLAWRYRAAAKDVLRMPTSRATGDLFRLDGRVALITGAGGAFGRAIALGFTEVGARLFLTDLDGA